MASTINAAVGGIVQTADTSGALALQTGGVTAISVSTGQVTTLANALPVASGGTGLTSTPTNGQIDIGNGTGFTRTTLSAGTNMSITNGAGSISIATTAVSAGKSIALAMIFGF